MIKSFRFIISLLIISNINLLNSQSLKLVVIAETDYKTSVIDSISYKKRFKDYKSLNNELTILKEKLIKQGYIDAFIQKTTFLNDSLVSAELELGGLINRIRIYYNQNSAINFFKSNNIDHTKNYVELKISETENFLNNLNSDITTKGDPFAKVQLYDIRKLNSNVLAADLKIITSDKRKIDDIIIKGYAKFPKSFLKHFLKLKKKQLFNLVKIKEKVSQLNNLNFAGIIKDPEVLFTEDATNLYLYIEKSKINNFDGFLGFGTNKKTNKIEFDGYLDLKLINNLNFGETLNLYYKSDEIDQQTIRVNADLPYLLGGPIGLQIGLQLFRKDSTFLNANQNIKLNYKLNSKHEIGIGISSKNSSNLLDNDTSILKDYNSSFYTFNYSYLKPQYNDRLFPVNFSINFNSEFGKRSNALESQSQNIFEINAQKIFNLNSKNSIYTKIQGSILNSNNFLDNELFRFGGINSIRGFEENSLVANNYGVVNTEYRYRASNNLYIHSVIDAAYFENSLSNIKRKLFGFGFGFGILTNSGLFRLNYANGKTENGPFKFSESKVHLSLTTQF